MRSALLPSALCVSPYPPASSSSTAIQHAVITAPDTCESFRRFEEARQMHSLLQCSHHQRNRFRLDDFLPVDWSHLLVECRRLTTPLDSVNFSSPGDPTSSDSSIRNASLMHVVHRHSGDFSPNNYVYHQLQKLKLTDSSNDFTCFIRKMQCTPPHIEDSRIERLIDESSWCDQDPLCSNPEALSRSAQNYSATSALRAECGMMPFSKCDSSISPSFCFFPHDVDVAACLPYCSRFFCVVVNLKPIVPYHLMVVPLRCLGTIHSLTAEEVEDWGRTMALCINVLRTALTNESEDYSFSVAIQQGILAGQTVPHLHTHVIPFDSKGKLVSEPECEEVEQRSRPPRTIEAMRMETNVLRPLFQQHAAKDM